MLPQHPWKRVSAAAERGQAFVIVVVALVPLLAIAGFVIDIGWAYKTQRALQASADAAALAGAQELPNSGASTAMATAYGTGGKNKLDGVTVSENVTAKCLTSIPGCNPANAIAVEESASVPTFFAKVVGINSINLKAKATACSPCGSRPVDIMLVVDRTWSMCSDKSFNYNGCTELNAAKTGVNAFLSSFDAHSAKIGLAVFPPAPSLAGACSDPANYSSSSYPYVLVGLSSNYRNGDGTLNKSSSLYTTTNCLKAKSTTYETAYANAIEAAQSELEAHGRTGVPKVIVFFTDGAANTGPTYSPYNVLPGKTYLTKPCQSGVSSASNVKAKGTKIYSIGYAVNEDICRNGSTHSGESGMTDPAVALTQIASTPGDYYDTPDADDLASIYSSIAQDISQGSSSLIDDGIQ
jgi:hypothetical protein